MKRFLVALVILTMTAFPALADMTDGFTLKLTANPTTGYDWQYKVENEALLAVEELGYAQDGGAGNAVGAGGEYSFALKGLAKGATIVTFTYSRAWDAENTTLCTLVYQVETDGDGDVEVYGCQVNPGL